MRKSSFHSISFPNEWGADTNYEVNCDKVQNSQVSIQLVSPTSGEIAWAESIREKAIVSIQLVSPTSGEPNQPNLKHHD
jgi:hypothetical protein